MEEGLEKKVQIRSRKLELASPGHCPLVKHWQCGHETIQTVPLLVKILTLSSLLLPWGLRAFVSSSIKVLVCILSIPR